MAREQIIRIYLLWALWVAAWAAEIAAGWLSFAGAARGFAQLLAMICTSFALRILLSAGLLMLACAGRRSAAWLLLFFALAQVHTRLYGGAPAEFAALLSVLLGAAAVAAGRRRGEAPAALSLNVWYDARSIALPPVHFLTRRAAARCVSDCRTPL